MFALGKSITELCETFLQETFRDDARVFCKQIHCSELDKLEIVLC